MKVYSAVATQTFYIPILSRTVKRKADSGQAMCAFKRSLYAEWQISGHLLSKTALGLQGKRRLLK